MPRGHARSTEGRRDPREIQGSFEWMEHQVVQIGREGVEDRETLGQVVCTTCLIHGRHRAQVAWVQIPVVRVDTRGRWPRVEARVVEMPSIQTACGPACGPRFGWGAGCEH